MDIARKLEILSAAARYDASCSSSGGGGRRAPAGGIGNTSSGGICHSWADDGRCISLLKLLLSNCCVYDCAYCANRRSNDVPRATFTPDEVVTLTLDFYRRNYIEGLFLSSGVLVSPDHTMERLVLVAEKLRNQHGFGGYIHLKAIPGASPELVRRAGLCVDRLSVNIELPSGDSLQKLAPEKSKTDILRPMGWIGDGILESRAERRKSRRAPRFAPAGQSTQMIVGASPESDLHILKLSANLYHRYDLKRVYYSAYVPVNTAGNLPVLRAPPLLREHRLYQADWLMRFYGFACDEILDAESPNLDETLDPKAAWALRNPHFFPVDVNRAEHGWLLRVPGIGVTSAARIATARRCATLRYDDLKTLGVVLKRARFFIRCPGMPAALSALPSAASVPAVRLALTDGGASPAQPQQLLLGIGQE